MNIEWTEQVYHTLGIAGRVKYPYWKDVVSIQILSKSFKGHLRAQIWLSEPNQYVYGK